jgi:hypothetical protein
VVFPKNLKPVSGTLGQPELPINSNFPDYHEIPQILNDRMASPGRQAQALWKKSSAGHISPTR